MGYNWEGQWDGQGEDPSTPPQGFARMPDGTIAWNGGGEAPIMRPEFNSETNRWQNMNGGFGANYTPVTASSVMDTWNKVPSKYRDALSSMQFDPISYATISGSAPIINNDTDFQNVVNWQKAIMQTPSFRGEGNFDNPLSGALSLWNSGAFIPIKLAMGMYAGGADGLSNLFSGGDVAFGNAFLNGTAGAGDALSQIGNMADWSGGFSDFLNSTSDMISGGAPTSQALSSVENMSNGLQNIGNFTDPGTTFNPDVLNPSSPTLTPDTPTALSNTADLSPSSDITNGNLNVEGTGQGWNPGNGELPKGYDGAYNPNPYKPDFGNAVDAQKAIDYGSSLGTAGYDGMSIPPMDTLGSTNKLSSLFKTVKGGGMSLKDFMTSPIGGGQRGLFQAPTPLGMVGKGLSALFDVNSNKNAMKFYKTTMDQMNNWVDPNRARGDQANNMWLQNWQNPTQAYSEFMTGAGRDFVESQRRQASQGGHRGNYLNSGKAASDLLSAFMKQQSARGDALAHGFVGGNNNYAQSATMAPAMASMIRNQYAPIGQAISSIDRGFNLYDLFGES